MKMPCDKNCPNRSMYCHSECMTYLMWQIQHEQERERMHKEKQLKEGETEWGVKMSEIKRKLYK